MTDRVHTIQVHQLVGCVTRDRGVAAILLPDNQKTLLPYPATGL
jgi:hypothetical protein